MYQCIKFILFWNDTLHVSDSWSWTEGPSETCRVSFQNKFDTLVHLVGFTIEISAVSSFQKFDNSIQCNPCPDFRKHNKDAKTECSFTTLLHIYEQLMKSVSKCAHIKVIRAVTFFRSKNSCKFKIFWNVKMLFIFMFIFMFAIW